MKKYDLSIHFSLKVITPEEVEQKIRDWENSPFYEGQFDDDETDTEIRTVLHHCFLPDRIIKEKNLSRDVLDMLDMLSDDNVCWYGVSGENLGIVWDRVYMLENIKKVNGTSIFVGEIIDGVKDEYDIAIRLGIDCVLIP